MGRFFAIVKVFKATYIFSSAPISIKIFTKILATTCEIKVNGDMPKPEPLLIQPNTKNFVLPYDKQGIIEISQGEELELFCNFGFKSPATYFPNQIVKCLGNTTFSKDGVIYDFKDFECVKQDPVYRARKVRKSCYNDGIIVNVGFEVDKRFMKTFEVCHDMKTGQNYYARYNFVPGNYENEHGVARPEFFQGEFFPGLNIDRLFKSHRDIVAEIVGSKELMLEYIPNGSETYLARGHISAKADFIFGPHQIATFFYINTAPQWQSFNGYNWVSVEDGSRRLAGNRNINLEIITGTHGVTTLKDINGIHQELYLGYPNKTIPVPKIYYRILIDKEHDSGIVLIGVNNPHLTLEEIKKDYVLCTDVSDKIDYIPWKKDSIYNGYSYACEVDEFVKVVPHVDVTVSKLLV